MRRLKCLIRERFSLHVSDIESSPLFALGPYDGWVTVKEGASVDADIDGPIEYTFIVKVNSPVNSNYFIYLLSNCMSICL